MSKGYLILAENSPSGNYLEMAYALCMSIKCTQSEVKQVAVMVPEKDIETANRYDAFDYVEVIPWGDQNEEKDEWKVKNKWKIIHASPFDETVFLDADMLFFRDVSNWWPILSKQDMWFSTHPLNYQGQSFEGDYYRQVFTANKLPNIYNCFFYFQKTEKTYEFFEMMKTITWDWDKFEKKFLSEKRPKGYSGDVAFALALRLTGTEGTNRYFDIPRFIHMRTQGQGWEISPDKKALLKEDWTKYLSVHFTPDLECYVGGYRILEPFHYHVKSFLTPEIIQFYEERLRVLGFRHW
jgi:hypothetical protein